jgi:hypothetical protein
MDGALRVFATVFVSWFIAVVVTEIVDALVWSARKLFDK